MIYGPGMCVAQVLKADHPPLADKLRAEPPHWMRHSHASLALSKGAELKSVRGNLRHASVATTSIHLHSDDVKRARQNGRSLWREVVNREVVHNPRATRERKVANS